MWHHDNWRYFYTSHDPYRYIFSQHSIGLNHRGEPIIGLVLGDTFQFDIIAINKVESLQHVSTVASRQAAAKLRVIPFQAPSRRYLRLGLIEKLMFDHLRHQSVDRFHSQLFAKTRERSIVITLEQAICITVFSNITRYSTKIVIRSPQKRWTKILAKIYLESRRIATYLKWISHQ